MVVFQIVFSNVCAEYCAVSLVPGCSFDVTCFTIHNDWGLDVISFGAQTCHLACLSRPLQHLGGSSSDPGALGSTRRETLGSMLRFLLFSGGFRDRILRVVG